ncbi:MAG TPA: oligosaccharide flippase family protein [Gemmatimonadaceae bacterium]|nr:oligosaccharide flippase family protein [Gemmatimonadaceae bacterium]
MPPRGIGARFMALGGGEAAARLAAFAATVYLARTLSPAMYGIVGVAMGVMLYLTQLADGGIELVGVPLVARNRGRLAELAEPILSLRFVASIVLALVVVAAGLTVLPQPDGAVMASSALALAFTGLSVRWIHLGFERAGEIAVSRTLGEAVALLAIVLLVHGAGDVGHVPLAQFIGAAVTAMVLLATLQRRGHRLRWRWDPVAARPVFARSRHLIVFTLLGLLLFNFDLIYLRLRSGAAAAGYYAAAYTMVAFAANLIVAFAHTVLPTLSRLEGEREEREALFTTACAQAFAIALPVGVGAWYISAQVVGEIFGAAYLPGVVALQWLAWSIPLAALRELPVVALIAAGEERELLRVNAIAAGCNVALVVAAVPRWGLEGAAAATLATELIRLGLAAHYARRAGYPVVPPRRLYKATLASAAMAAGLIILAPRSLLGSVPLGGAIYGAVLVLVGGFALRGRTPVLSV